MIVGDISRYFMSSAKVLDTMSADVGLAEQITKVGELLVKQSQAGKKILLVGNGGSAADAEHFAAELVGTYRNKNRRGLPALALTVSGPVLTAAVNDMGEDEMFARQVEAYGQPGDVLVALTTSGQSSNVLEALAAANGSQMHTVALTGSAGIDPRLLDAAADHELRVPSDRTPLIQQGHTAILHALCEMIDDEL